MSYKTETLNFQIGVRFPMDARGQGNTDVSVGMNGTWESLYSASSAMPLEDDDYIEALEKMVSTGLKEYIKRLKQLQQLLQEPTDAPHAIAQKKDPSKARLAESVIKLIGMANEEPA